MAKKTRKKTTKGRQIKKIVLHASDSGFGDATLIDEWHKARGWKGIGYHFVVLNGYREAVSNTKYVQVDDGLVEPGRPLDEDHILEPREVGAHTEGHNRDSIGICLIGRRGGYSVRQFLTARQLVLELLERHGLTADDVYGHRDFTDKKTCPDFDTEDFRQLLRNEFQPESVLTA